MEACLAFVIWEGILKGIFLAIAAFICIHVYAVLARLFYRFLQVASPLFIPDIQDRVAQEHHRHPPLQAQVLDRALPAPAFSCITKHFAVRSWTVC